MLQSEPEKKNERPDEPDSRERFEKMEQAAYKDVCSLIQLSIGPIAAKVRELRATHAGAYDQSLQELGRRGGFEADDIEGPLHQYLRRVVECLNSVKDKVYDTLQKGGTAEVEHTRLFYGDLFKLSASYIPEGGYRIEFTLQAPKQEGDQPREISQYRFQLGRGHALYAANPDFFSGNKKDRQWESLAALDSALPFYSDSKWESLAQPRLVERAYLLANSGFMHLNGPGRRFPHYYSVELPGNNLAEKLHGAEKFLSCEEPGNERIARAALPEGYRDARISCWGLQTSLVLGVEKHSLFSDFFNLVQSGATGEWYVLSSALHPTFNDSNAYVLIRRRLEDVAIADKSLVLTSYLGLPTERSGDMCRGLRGGFVPLTNFGKVVERESPELEYAQDRWQMVEMTNPEG